MSDFWFYLKMGLTHVLDINAYDHVLFLIALTVPYTFKDWKRVLTLVTMFTLGHTLALILATYGVVSINASYVEFLIPITILITAVFNVFTAGKGARKEKLGLTFFVALFFGLIHGLGFSNFFRMNVSGKDSKLLPMLEFALGVEAAQVIIVLIVLILGFLFQSIFRFNKRDWIMVISSIVIGFVIPMIRGNWLW
ncbi:HupE/UreJ family protein [Robertkochia solimangrovi]|uniref:HupE/UreJ family protein n=1 Tax=Robertkochia solimangrovi TaxID=2213046 RepID=UPI001181333F|nr:HupE/UreJ family protein [Robertkochia solimangrovi]TRZ45940.1 HupE/UreJ family protein [Robertkochia solimangrovi]